MTRQMQLMIAVLAALFTATASAQSSTSPGNDARAAGRNAAEATRDAGRAAASGAAEAARTAGRAASAAVTPGDQDVIRDTDRGSTSRQRAARMDRG
ncbi:MAG TPA: hypothetical protein VFP68_07995 [Burkholderiaceae bacterium]|nr:hypothetical protein [Burkholderiaceae bacterium]